MSLRVFPIVLISALAAVDCLSTNMLEPDEKPVPGSAYIYGRFKHAAAEHGGRIGLAIRNANTGTEYVLVFHKTKPVYALSLEPGTYKITEVVYYTGLGREKGRRLFLPPPPFEYMNSLFQVPPGSLTYLGDFGASTLVRGKDHIWRFHSIREQHRPTSARLADVYPHFRALLPGRRAFRPTATGYLLRPRSIEATNSGFFHFKCRETPGSRENLAGAPLRPGMVKSIPR